MNLHPKFIFRTPLGTTENEINNNVFSEALFIASNVLHQEYIKSLQLNSNDSKENKKLRISIHKYHSRGTSRCTPFGLFAGLSIGDWADKNKIIIDSVLENSLVRKTRLDMGVLCYLAQEISKLSYVKKYIKYFVNNSTYLIGDSYRYVEYYYQGSKRVHNTNRVDYSDYLEHIFSKLKNGLTIVEITEVLANFTEVSNEEALLFVEELITSQILINELEPNVTGNDYFTVLINKLKEIQLQSNNEEFATLINTLCGIDLDLKKIDQQIINPINEYEELYLKLRTIINNIGRNNLIQVDLYKKTIERKLNKEINEQLAQAITFLNKISPPTINRNLEDFKRRFKERFEENEIPILLALDTETGIGYINKDLNGINPLIDDIPNFIDEGDNTLMWNMLQSCLLKLIQTSIKNNKKIIEVSESDFKVVDFSKSVLPCTYSIMFSVLDCKTNKIELGSIGGSSATALLGRFAGGNEELNEILKDIADFEEKKMNEKILAEIVHLPESRTGNILARPIFRKHEINYLAKSSVAHENTIKMEDLVIKIRQNNIILFDKRLNKEIIPRLGNAHNYRNNSLPAYHFLCDLQNQYFTKSYFGFNWGVLMNQFSFLPRVEYKNTVLYPAIWKLNKMDLEPVNKKNITDSEKIAQFFELKNLHEIPEKFLIADGDNELLIDTSKPISIDVFLDIIKSRNEIVLKEYLFNDEYPLITDSEGKGFANECIAIVLNDEFKIQSYKEIEENSTGIKQIFSVGSEWLYYKIYSGAKTADKILTEYVQSVTDKLIMNGWIDKWFFIRYSDPEIHIRFRIHIIDKTKYGEIVILLNSLFEPLILENIISKLQIDTYKRELIRYGHNSIELVETLFFYDSVFVSKCLGLLEEKNGGNVRWQLALCSVDKFLSDFGLSNENKLELIEKLNEAFFQEHGGKKDLKLRLDSKYRSIRSKVEYILDDKIIEKNEYTALKELINERSLANKPIVNKLAELDLQSKLKVNINSLIGNLMHMNLDRLFMGRNRTNEFVVYDILNRYYKSLVVRKNKQAATFE